MRIAFCGAGGTGKGTISRALVNRLADSFRPHVLLESPNEMITKSIAPNSKNYRDLLPLEYVVKQYAILHAQIWQETQAGNFFVSERSVIDYAAYFDEMWPKKHGLDISAIHLGQRYQAIIKEHLLEHPYDIVFSMIPDFVPADAEENSWKERSEEARKKTSRFLSEYIYRLYSSPEIKTHFFCLFGDANKRIHDAMSIINNFASGKYENREKAGNATVA